MPFILGFIPGAASFEPAVAPFELVLNEVLALIQNLTANGGHSTESAFAAVGHSLTTIGGALSNAGSSAVLASVSAPSTVGGPSSPSGAGTAGG